MSVNVRPGTYEEVKPLTHQARRERVTMENPEGAAWFVAEEDGVIVGCVCAVIKKKGARFKSDFILPAYRKQKIYRDLFKIRTAHALQYPTKQWTAFCTPQSLKVYLENKFQKVSLHRDIWFVKREFKGKKETE
jgi:hypothetical protein